MAIHLDILTQLERQSVRAVTAELGKTFNDKTVEITPEISAAAVIKAREKIADIQRRFDKLRADVEVNIDVKDRDIAESRAKIKAGVSGVKAKVDVDVDNSAFKSTLKNVADDIQHIVSSPGRIFSSGPGMALLAVVAGGLTDIAKVAVTASQSIFEIPAAAAAAAAGMGTLKLATAGFGQAIQDIGDPKKFAADLQSLAPSAQQAALSIQNLMPQFTALKTATQDAFFAGFGEKIFELTNTFLPSIQSMTTTIASSFNRMITGIADQMMTLDNQAQLREIMTNIGQGFDNLVPAAQSFAQAFIDITNVGSGFLPGLASDISSVAANFAEFIRSAKESGKLKEWIQNGIDAVKEIGRQIFSVGETVYRVFGKDGKKNIEDFKRTMEEWKPILEGILRIFDDIAKVIHFITGSKGLYGDLNKPSPGAVTQYGPSATAPPSTPGAAPPGLSPGDAYFRQQHPELFPPGLPGGAPSGGPGTPGAPSGGPDFGGGLTGKQHWGSAYPGPFPVPAAPPGSAGSAKDRRDAIIAGLDPSTYQVDPYAPVPGLPTAGPPPGKPGQYGPTVGGAVGMPQPGESPRDFAHRVMMPYWQSQGFQVGDHAADQFGEHQNGALDIMVSNLAEGNRVLQQVLADPNAYGAIFNNQIYGYGQGSTPRDYTAGHTGDPSQDHLNHIHALYRPGVGAIAPGGVGPAGMYAQPGGRGGYFQVDPQKVLEQQHSVESAAHDLEDARKNRLALEKDNQATAQEIADAKWKETEAGWKLQAEQAALAKVQQGTYESMSSSANSMSKGMGQIGAALDKDFGISKGLPGIAENLVKFVANLAFAPMLGQLSAIQAANPSQGGYGLMGIMGAQGAFGPQFTGLPGAPGMGPSAMGPAALGGGLGGIAGAQVQHLANWDATAQGESSGNWGINTGNGYSGGLQFTPSSWAAAGGTQFAPAAYLATPEQQKTVADQLYRMQGPGAWPNTFVPNGPAPGYDEGGPVPPGGDGNFNPGITIDTSRASMSKNPYAGNYADLLTPGGAHWIPGSNPNRQVPIGVLPADYNNWLKMMIVQADFMGKQHYADGGDVSPAMLTPGEHVLTTDDVKAMGGQGGVYDFRRSLHGYQDGGGVPQKPQYGGVTPTSNPGGGGLGITPGGTIDTAMNLAAGAADLLAPGAGQAAATGMKLANRAIQYAGQVAGIMASGWMETFLPTGGSELANNNWLTRLGGALAGAAPALPNAAGGPQGTSTPSPPPLTPQQVMAPPAAPDATPPDAGTTINLEYTNIGAPEDRAAADITHHLGNKYAPAGTR